MEEHTEFIPYKSVKLEKLQFGIQMRISKHLIDEDPDAFNDIVACQIRGYVWSQDAGKKETFIYPADWWQAFKERWFPMRLLQRFPVVYIVKEFLVKATYPDLAVQNHEPVLRLIESTYRTDFSPVTEYGRPEHK